MIQQLSYLIVVTGIFLLVSCATNGELKTAVAHNINDPHENINRNIYEFNSGVDKYISSPLVTVYQFILPDFLTIGIANFFTNLTEPRTIINDILQGKGISAAKDFGRFAVNSLLGLGGLINVASYAKIEHHQEDFSQTMAIWGVPRGEYIVIPVLGPSSYRGILGKIVDTASSPASYLIWPIQLLGLLNSRSNADQSLNFIDETAIDPYLFTRDSYLQWRDFQISEGENIAEAILLPNLDESFDDEDLDLLGEDLDIKL